MTLLAKLSNIEFRVADLEKTRAFYVTQLELEEANFDLEDNLLAIFLKGCTVRFKEHKSLNQNDSDINPINFIGIEYDSFKKVDELYEKIRKTDPKSILSDSRDIYKYQKGPYGFYILDPDNYKLKIHKYNFGKNDIL